MEWKFKTKGCGLVIYEKGTEDTRYLMTFDMESKTVSATCDSFIYKDENVIVPQNEKFKHTCKYGHLQRGTMDLSLEDIEFMHKKANELWRK